MPWTVVLAMYNIKTHLGANLWTLSLIFSTAIVKVLFGDNYILRLWKMVNYHWYMSKRNFHFIQGILQVFIFHPPPLAWIQLTVIFPYNVFWGLILLLGLFICLEPLFLLCPLLSMKTTVYNWTKLQIDFSFLSSFSQYKIILFCIIKSSLQVIFSIPGDPNVQFVSSHIVQKPNELSQLDLSGMICSKTEL